MCTQRVRCDAAKEMIYKVFLYFTNESEIFVTDNGYFDKVRQRVSDATGVNLKSVYQIVKDMGKPTPPVVKPQKVWVKKKSKEDTKFQTELSKEQSNSANIRNTDASAKTNNATLKTVELINKKTANVKSIANNVPENVNIDKTGPKRINIESNTSKISETVIVKRPRQFTNPENPGSEKIQINKKIYNRKTNLFINDKIIHKNGIIIARICKANTPESKTTQLTISNKSKNNQTSYINAEQNLPSNMTNILDSKDIKPGSSLTKIKKENNDDNNVDNHEPALAPIKYIKPDPELSESGVLPIEMEPALKNECPSDSDEREELM